MYLLADGHVKFLRFEEVSVRKTTRFTKHARPRVHRFI